MNDQHDEGRVRQILQSSEDGRSIPPFEQLLVRSPRRTIALGRSVFVTVTTVVVAVIALVAGGQLAAVRHELQRPATAGTAIPSASASRRAALPPTSR